MSSSSIRRQLLSIGAKLRSRLTLSSLRPLPVFLGLSSNGRSICINPQAFHIPYADPTTDPTTDPTSDVDPTSTSSDPASSTLKYRYAQNLNYFLTNYILLLFLTTLIISLSHPLMLLILSALLTLHFLLSKSSHPSRSILKSTLQIASGYYVIFHVLTKICTIIFITLVFVGVHAGVRRPVRNEKEQGDQSKVEGV